MRIYLAATYARHPEMRRYRDSLDTMPGRPVRVVSTWIEGEYSDALDPVKDPRLAWKLAQRDLEDLDRADAVIAFTEAGSSSSRGGRHVEFGYALASGKPIYVIGPRENIFYASLGIKSWATFGEFKAWFGEHCAR